MISGDAGLPDFCTVAVCKCKTGLIPECSKLANHFVKAQGERHLAGLNRGVCELRRCVDTLRAAGAAIPQHLRDKAARGDCLSASAQQGIPWSRVQVERLIAYKEHHVTVASGQRVRNMSGDVRAHSAATSGGSSLGSGMATSPRSSRFAKITRQSWGASKLSCGVRTWSSMPSVCVCKRWANAGTLWLAASSARTDLN